jgi:mannose-P-dolichol utilization defect protein 1
MTLLAMYSKTGTVQSLLQNGFWVVYAGMAYCLITPTVVAAENLPYLQMATIPLFIISRATQIITNLMRGNVGALSLITVFLQFAGSAARVFTTIQEVSDKVVLYGFLIGLTLNTILFLQVLLMSGEPSVVVPTKDEKPKKK